MKFRDFAFNACQGLRVCSHVENSLVRRDQLRSMLRTFRVPAAAAQAGSVPPSARLSRSPAPSAVANCGTRGPVALPALDAAHAGSEIAGCLQLVRRVQWNVAHMRPCDSVRRLRRHTARQCYPPAALGPYLILSAQRGLHLLEHVPLQVLWCAAEID